MKKAWVVVRDWDYEDTEILCVCGSPRLAEEKREHAHLNELEEGLKAGYRIRVLPPFVYLEEEQD